MNRSSAAALLALATVASLLLPHALSPARAAPEAAQPATEASFQFDPGETAVVSQRFASEPAGWDHADTEFAGGELRALPATRWAHATLRVDGDRALSDGVWTFYWTCRTDAKKGEDASALHVKLWVTDDAEREEQISINALLRATRGWYMLYVDPGYMVEHASEMHLLPKRNEFPDAHTLRSFRLRSVPAGEGKLAVTLERWDEASAAWIGYDDYPTKSPAAPLPVDVAEHLGGHATIKGLHFMFPHPAAAVSATALTFQPAR